MKIMLITLASVVIMTTLGWVDDNLIPEKAIARDRLVAIAKNKGFVKVIVQLDVPDIEELTASSTRHKAVTPGKTFSDEGVQADKALALRIASVSEDVLSQLKTHEVVYKINHTYSTLPLLALDISEEALEVLELAPEIIRIEEDRPVPAILENTTNIIGADTAWSNGYTGSGWYVAILDTGIRSGHDFFSGKTIVEACYSADGHCPCGLTEVTGAGAAAIQRD